MLRGSIAIRLFWYSLCWLIVALAVTAFLLTDLYSRALDNTLQDTLEFHLESLVGVALTGTDGRIPSSSIADPRFARPASGWYWEIREGDGDVIGYSSSLIGSALPVPEGQLEAGDQRTEVQKDVFGTNIRMFERRITLDGDDLIITVTGNLDENYQLVDSFRGQTLIVLGAVAAMMAIMSGIVARFALRPIGRLRRAVEKVREGETERVEGVYPAEIAPLADEVNELLRSNIQIIERARSQVGNLAHGLKTPLAVMRNEAAGSRTGLARIVLTEAEKMNGLVALYLDRARLAARTAVVGRKSDARAVTERLVRVMTKLNPGRNIAFDAATTPDIWFRGEESDFEEMAGNLIDNACKWARSEIRVRLEPLADAERKLVLSVDDDGPGLGEEEIARVQKRGVRLDERTPGSGLGLDIVKELVDVYGGTLHMGRSRLGGLNAKLILPAARAKGR